MYANDTQFLDADYPTNIQALKSRIESSLSVALRWFTQNRLRINPAKTEIVLLRSRRTRVSLDFRYISAVTKSYLRLTSGC